MNAVPAGAKTKRSFKGLALGLFAALALVAGGLAAGVYASQSGFIGSSGPAKGHAAEPAPKSESSSTDYVVLEQGFTSNLKESESFVQVSVAVSTHGGERAKEVIKTNEPALRSVILQTLAEQDYASMASTAGRKALQARLKQMLDAELEAKVGSGGIDNVYFTAFVLQ